MSSLPIREIQDLYDEIDRSITTFKLATGLRCRQPCGRCCPGAPIQVTVAEMLPAAAALHQSNQIDRWFQRLDAASDTCAGFSATPIPETGGHCLLYPNRPAVCRLFGFAAVRNRLGKRELSTCLAIRQDLPEAVSRAAALLADGGPVPLLAGYSQRLFGFDPTAHPMPINQALARAIERCGLKAALEHPAAIENFPRAG